MAGHYRVAVSDAQVGQPEVKIGLIPGAGGTQRLPRLAGVVKAAEMCAFGEPISAKDALAAGIIDTLIAGDLLEGAMAFARTVSAPRRTCDLPVTPADISGVRKKLRGALIAPELALDAVEAAMTLPFADGIRREAELFERCLHSDQSKALIHAFFAERAVAKIPRHSQGHAALHHPERGRNRGGHHGRRDRDGSGQCGHSGSFERHGASRARSRHGGHPQELRAIGEKRAAHGPGRGGAHRPNYSPNRIGMASIKPTSSSKRCSNHWR